MIGTSSVAGVLICLAAVLCAILIKPAPAQLTISVNEISLAVDDVKPIEFEVSDETATVSFEIYDPKDFIASLPRNQFIAQPLNRNQRNRL